MTQLYGRSKLSSFDEEVASDDLGEPLLLHDVLSDGQEDPATRAARSMDWDAFMSGLSKRDKAIIECLVKGKPLSSLARKRGFNSSTLRYGKERLATAIQQFMGRDILACIQTRPSWKDSINAAGRGLPVEKSAAACNWPSTINSPHLLLHGPALSLGGAMGWWVRAEEQGV